MDVSGQTKKQVGKEVVNKAKDAFGLNDDQQQNEQDAPNQPNKPHNANQASKQQQKQGQLSQRSNQDQKQSPVKQAYDQEEYEQNNLDEKQELADKIGELNQSASKKQQDDPLKNSKLSKTGKQDLWKPYDFLFPGGKLAKLIKINNIYKKNLPIRDMLDKFKFTQMTPVINLIGAMEKGRGKFYAGISRAAFNTDAVVVDNGLACGLEKFTLRRGVKLVGIAPQREIKFPKINPSKVDPFELANGHTHLFLVNNPQKDLAWGGQTAFKIDLCIKIAEGKKRAEGVKRCKIVSILMGDADFDVIDEIKLSVENGIPIIVVSGSALCDKLIKVSNGDQGEVDGQLQEVIDKGHFFYCNSTNSEDIAQLTHLLLSITPW